MPYYKSHMLVLKCSCLNYLNHLLVSYNLHEKPPKKSDMCWCYKHSRYSVCFKCDATEKVLSCFLIANQILRNIQAKPICVKQLFSEFISFDYVTVEDFFSLLLDCFWHCLTCGWINCLKKNLFVSHLLAWDMKEKPILSVKLINNLSHCVFCWKKEEIMKLQRREPRLTVALVALCSTDWSITPLKQNIAVMQASLNSLQWMESLASLASGRILQQDSSWLSHSYRK